MTSSFYRYFLFCFPVILITAAVTEFGLLGYDTFGRDLLQLISHATINSLLFGLVLFLVSISFPLLAVLLEFFLKRVWVKTLVDWLSLAIESLPIFFWILVIVFSYGTASVVPIVIAFSLAVFPICHRVVSGEVVRISSKDFVLASECLGASRLQIFLKHIIPNAAEVLTPVAIHIFGAAIAIRGAIFALGFGNRQDVDLGILLFVGKENFIGEPKILIASTAMYFIVYLYLFIALRLAGTSGVRPNTIF